MQVAFVSSHYDYGIELAIVALGLGLIDYRYKLVWWASPMAALKTIVALVGFFTIWDVGGIVLKIFSTNSDLTSGVNLFSSNLPVEEIIFLSLFTYVGLLVCEGIKQ